jgi:hypothetical protein
MENYLRQNLPSLVTPEQLQLLLKNTASINALPTDVKIAVIKVFADGYTLQMKITAGISALQLLAIGLIWDNPQILVAGKGLAADG